MEKENQNSNINIFQKQIVKELFPFSTQNIYTFHNILFENKESKIGKNYIILNKNICTQSTYYKNCI